MTPGSKEKPLRLSTAWQLSDLWGLRTGRKMSLFPLCIPETSGGNKEFRIQNTCLSFSCPFYFPSDSSFLSSEAATSSPCCSSLCVLLYAHVFEHTMC